MEFLFGNFLTFISLRRCDMNGDQSPSQSFLWLWFLCCMQYFDWPLGKPAALPYSLYIQGETSLMVVWAAELLHTVFFFFLTDADTSTFPLCRSKLWPCLSPITPPCVSWSDSTHSTCPTTTWRSCSMNPTPTETVNGFFLLFYLQFSSLFSYFFHFKVYWKTPGNGVKKVPNTRLKSLLFFLTVLSRNVKDLFKSSTVSRARRRGASARVHHLLVPADRRRGRAELRPQRGPIGRHPRFNPAESGSEVPGTGAHSRRQEVSLSLLLLFPPFLRCFSLLNNWSA